jgi:orotate phosphoribosyltransferase
VSAERELARLVVDVGAVRLGEFKLSSEARSSVYVDLRVMPMHPREFRRALEILAEVAREAMRESEAEVIAGVATGGIVWAIGLALALEAPATYVRLQAKGHGTSRRVEADVSGRGVLVVDDVATTGSSIAGAVEALREAGARVGAALVVVDRLQGARERLESMGVRLYAGTTLREVLLELEARGLYDRALLERAWREVGS